MANKPSKSDRRAIVDEMRKKQKGAERRRGFAIVGVCATIAILIVVAAAYRPLKDKYDERAFRDKHVDQIGAAASVCQPVTTKKADGNQQHVPEGTTVDYTTAPPAFGAHWAVAGYAPDPMARKFYSTDRPPLEVLVHNLEHGYTILWYDTTAAKNSKEMAEIRAIADKFTGTGNLRLKFKAVPWESSDEDGKKFPDGEHIAFSHWSAGGTKYAATSDTSKQVGVFQYCSDVSGSALQAFMLKYPYLDSPEPGAA